ncbi:hypothetical protein KOI35_32510 [Actinoplanes bogorensis]|uniref:Uncharacterized protein n=1 Tax=Paractinoplanes bogorensis TaxID=1610840 RepID=A0ABS5YXT2_9ACTN|nr:hypothetical protein [Actinoplanes bogorensis]MBU2668245.1 hypothetical protein [Actinoplanes bogorensis]
MDTYGNRHEDAMVVLSATRGVITRGWVQHSWYLTETKSGPRRFPQRFFPARLDRSQVVAACLVGGVMQGAWQVSPKPEYACPAIDALWRTLFDASTAGGADPVGPPVPPIVRAARVRDLTTWNDRPYRTADDVVRLLDLATARVTSQRTSGPVPQRHLTPVVQR